MAVVISLKMSPAEYSRRLSKLTKPVLQKLLEEQIKEHEVDLRDAKEAEFERGERPDGKLIGRYANAAYSRYKERRNPKARGNVDLIFTRSFITSFRIKRIMGNRYTFFATDQKTAKLVGKYGKDIMGLNQRTFNRFIVNRIGSDYVKAIKEYAKIR